MYRGNNGQEDGSQLALGEVGRQTDVAAIEGVVSGGAQPSGDLGCRSGFRSAGWRSVELYNYALQRTTGARIFTGESTARWRARRR